MAVEGIESGADSSREEKLFGSNRWLGRNTGGFDELGDIDT